MIHKKLHRFLLPTDLGSNHITDTRICHQVAHVLKMHPGESFIVFQNGGPDVTVTIQSIDKKSITIEKIDSKEVAPQAKKVIAAISIAKGQTFELIVQKLTELGVAEIAPLITSRTIKQSVRSDRLQVISDEALEQSGGNKRVVIHEPMKLEECLATFPFSSIVFHQGIPSTSQPTKDTTVMYIGPEGGWSEDDIALFTAHNVTSQSLGQRVLRTETAAIVGAYELLRT